MCNASNNIRSSALRHFTFVVRSLRGLSAVRTRAAISRENIFVESAALKASV